MEQAAGSGTRSYFRSSPSSAFDQYLHDIQKLPLIEDPAEERRLARLAQKGDEAALLWANTLEDAGGEASATIKPDELEELARIAAPRM